MKRREVIHQLNKKGIAFTPENTKAELLALLNGGGESVPASRSKITNRIVNFAGGKGRIEVVFNKDNADAPVEVMVCEQIGKDAWTGEGFSLKDLRDSLDGVPNTRDLHFFTNTPGGGVSEGISIRNWLNGWSGNITNTIIGIAASAGSWYCPADTTKAFKNSQMFVHRAMGMTFGNADDHRKNIEYLETTDRQIADMLAEDSGQTPEKMLQLMTDETLMTGQEALDLGLVDELIDGEAKNQFTADWLNSAKSKLAALNTLRPNAANGRAATNSALPPQGERKQTETTKPQDNIMNREKMIALLNKWGVIVPENATDEQLTALVESGKPATQNKAPEIINLDDHPTVKALNAQLTAQRRKDIQNHVETAATAGKIDVLEIENWTNDAVAAVDHPTNGNPVLARLNKLSGKMPGVPALPEGLNKLEVTGADFKDIKRGFEAHNEATTSFLRGNDAVSMKDIASAAVAKANFFKKFRNRFMEMVNTNTIDAGLQRQVILQDVVIRDFARRVLPLDMFSTVFRNVPLQGLNTVEVPYFDLDTNASTNFVSGTGYTTIGNTSSDKREITVGEGATNGKRKYQALAFSSQEIARQPYLKVAQLAGLKAEKLAFDIFQDVLSIVTAANYGAAAITGPADMFDSDDLADLKLACKAWPAEARGLLLDSAYDANLLKDPSFKYALNAASDSAIKEGRLFPRVMGFDYVENPNIPANAENLVGFAFWKYAILVAFAPVPPVDEVRRAGTTWELITDPATGISLEYRAFGNNVTDVATNVIESSYGFAKGLGTGIKRIVSA
jgi:ATP-dependent protease ClpP protease subunit